MGQPLASLLPLRGVLSLGGADRVTFLQGLVSNDVNAVLPGSAIYAALLTPQGKFLHDMFIIEAGDHFLLDCEAARADDLLKRLTAHKLRAKITLDKVISGYDVWAAWDGDAPKGWLPDPRLAALGSRILLKKGTKPDHVRAARFEDYDRHRISLGVPDGSRDLIVGKSTLAEGNLDLLNGISFTKGCYLGQELTARLHHRGLVKKRIFPVKITGVPPEFGSIVRDGADDIGDMRSACGERLREAQSEPISSCDVGLALLDISKAATKKTFTCDSSQLLVLDSFQKT
jgi:folate-binding protein YgfZ